MKITVETESYNEKRYGKPWIAKVEFESGSKLNYSWGDWCGDAGYSGQLDLVNINAGDIIARGQKDNRKSVNSAPDFYIVREGGELEQVTKLDAFKQYSRIPPERDIEGARTVLKGLHASLTTLINDYPELAAELAAELEDLLK